MTKPTLLAAAISCALTLAAGPARAELLAASHSLVDQVSGPSPPAVHVPLRINGNGFALSFATTAPNQRVAVLFNAECAVRGSAGAFVEVDIVIDQGTPQAVVATPSHSDDNALCSGNGSTAPGFTNFVSASTNAYATVPLAGAHTVRVTLRPIGPPLQWRIDDKSVLVMR